MEENFWFSLKNVNSMWLKWAFFCFASFVSFFFSVSLTNGENFDSQGFFEENYYFLRFVYKLQ